MEQNTIKSRLRLLEDINAYCKARPIKPSPLGLLVVGDPSIVRRIVQGRDIVSGTLDAFYSYFAANPVEGFSCVPPFSQPANSNHENKNNQPACGGELETGK